MTIGSGQPRIGDQAPLNKQEKPKEIERKFLVKKLPENLEHFKKKEITQGYISIGEDGSETRLRKKGDKYYRTFKGGKGKVREEIEIEISEPEFKALWPLVQDRIVDKARYEIPYDEDLVIELDVYKGKLEGLFSAEVEFQSEKDSDDFVPPVWFGDEKTYDNRYKNQNLALHGKPEEKKIRKDIPELNVEQGISTIVNKIKELQEKSSEPIIVCLAGSSASGKTSMVANKVKEQFGDTATIFSLDDYYRGGTYLAEQERLGNKLNFDQPEALKMDLIRHHLEKLKRGEDVIDRPQFDFDTGEPKAETKVFSARPIIIVEGLFALNDMVQDLADIKGFVDVSAHGRIIRRIVRDEAERGNRPANNIKYMLDTVEPMYDKYIEPTREKADMVIVNEFTPELETKRINKHELQVKFSGTLDDNQLRDLGANDLGTIIQKDAYYNPKGKDFHSSDEIMRIRRQGEQVSFTYKGPKVESDIRERPVYEFKIDEDTAKEFLKIYGDEETRVEKVRQLYGLPNGITIALDTVKKDGEDLGQFIEIRSSTGGVDEAEMKRIAEKLGLNPEKGIKGSYFEMQK